jgi:hypothetical protein
MIVVPEPANGSYTFLEALRRDDGIVLENALGVLAHWLEHSGHEPTPELIDAGLRLIDASFGDDGSPRSDMASLYRSLILRRIPDDVERLLPRLLTILRSEEGLDRVDLALVCRATAIDAVTSADAIVALVSEAVSGRGLHTWAWRLSSARMLSVLAGCTGTNEVVDALNRVGLTDLPALFAQVAVHSSDNATLDPMFQRLLELGGEDMAVWRAAASEFAMPEQAFRGNESDFLRGRAQVAADLAASSDVPLIQRWASWVSGQLSERTAEAELREPGEDDF